MKRRRSSAPPEPPARSVDLKAAAEERYLAYALSVITARALPDVRDGLKPVQRRILYAMYQNLRLTAGAKPRKSAAVVGEVLGKYHPHGDVAAYEAMVRMAQPFAMRYPLVIGEGNFGSLDGDSPAAMRYTEARLAPIAEELLRDIRHETVDFRDNYDATQKEPVVLPAAVPQLLINGSTGIAVGMATNIPPHNLREVVDALLLLIENPGASVRDLCRHIRAPDFPTGGAILNSPAELRQIYENGHGTIRLRGEYTVETRGRRRQVVINSVPYATNKARIIEEIAEHIASRKLPQATDVRDESTDTVRIVVETRPDASPEAVMAYLYRHTSLQVNFFVNLTALVPAGRGAVGQPARLDLRGLCRHFLDFRLEVVTRRLDHELRELEARLHILAGFLAIYSDLDRAIALIRAAASRADARNAIMDAFDLDERQAEAVLDTRLYQLARLEIERIRKEQKEKARRAREIRRLLANTAARWRIVADELRDVAERYGDQRRTRLACGAELVYDADAYVVHEDATVVITRDGWLKRVGELKDPSSTRVREGDAVRWVIGTNTRERIGLFSNRGTLYVMRVSNVPATTGYGEPVQSLLNFGDGEHIVAATRIAEEPQEQEERQADLFAREDHDRPLWLVATRRGMGFFCSPETTETTRSGRRFARLKEGDEVVSVTPARGDTVTACTRKGKVLRFPAGEVPVLTGPGQGVILMRVDADDGLVGALCHPSGTAIVARDEEGKERRLTGIEGGRRAQKGRKALGRFRAAEIRAEQKNGA